MEHFYSLDLPTQCSILVAAFFVVVIAWSVLTVKALHKRDIHFWSLGSTWVSIVAVPITFLIGQMSLFSSSTTTGPWMVAAGLYVLAFMYSLLYNSWITRSVIVGVATTILQQLAVLGIILIWIRFTSPPADRGHNV